jgi:hypothetical protein
MTEPKPNAEPQTPPARRFGPEDVLLVAGTALVAVGGWLAWRPLAFFIPGSICLVIAFLSARATR